MKETLYTIPLNDAVSANDECPFCYIEREVEQDLMDFVLGSGSSYMESDVRGETDKAGFCRAHFKKMFDYGNTLGNAWILKTHYMKINRDMKEQFKHFTPGKSSFASRFRKTPEEEKADTVAWETRQLEIMDWLTDDVDWLTGQKHAPSRCIFRQNA